MVAPLSINMQDAGVKRLLGPERELVHLAGDAPDPMGTDARGRQCTYNLNRSAIAHPVVVYRPGMPDEHVVTCDVYAYPGEPMVVHWICPRCHHALTIPESKKHIVLELGLGPLGAGRLSVEPFECTWELPDTGEHVPGLVGGGMSLCRMKLAIDNNVAKDA